MKTIKIYLQSIFVMILFSYTPRAYAQGLGSLSRLSKILNGVRKTETPAPTNSRPSFWFFSDDLSDEERLSRHMSRGSFDTYDEMDRVRDDLRQFLDSPLDILQNHPDRILDNESATRRAYLSLVLSHVDPFNADDMRLFTDSVIGGFLRKNEFSQNISVADGLDKLWDDILASTPNANRTDTESITTGVVNVLINDNPSYTGYVTDEVFKMSRIARLHDHPNLKLQPGNSGLMSRMMGSLSSQTSYSYSLSLKEEILFFWRYIHLDMDNTAFREGMDFLRGRIESVVKPPSVSVIIREPYGVAHVDAFLGAAKESNSLEKFVKRSLRSINRDVRRIRRIKDRLYRLKDKNPEEYDRIINTPGLENFSIEDWERVLQF